MVTKATLQVHSDDPAIISIISFSASTIDRDFWGIGATGLLRILQDLNQRNVSGHFTLTPSLRSGSSLTAELTLLFLGSTNISMVEELTHRQLSITKLNELSYELSFKVLPKVSLSFQMTPNSIPDTFGAIAGSLLISNQLFNSPTGPKKLAEVFAKLPLHQGDMIFTSNLGGRANEKLNLSMHPGWRSSAQLLTYARMIETTANGKRKALEELNNIQMPLLYSLEPDFNVSYFNLGDPNEKNSQEVYWGPNYKRLARIKQDVDKDGLFFSRLGVRSEEWDDEGMCRKILQNYGS